MIQGVHAMFYSSQPTELRAFIRDKLRLPFTDVGEGWLIFDAPEGDIGCHPTDGDPPSGTHNVSFYCDDIEKTVAELGARGVVFDEAIADQGFGLVTFMTLPGGVKVQLYQPRYAKRRASAERRKPARLASPKRSTRKRPTRKRVAAKRRGSKRKTARRR